ncbi:hypothetical protein GCM10022380_79200 [Amycolatopsis tucumanensis]|uniref:Uncharacterized protein n=1 Tax=Amycolatopsis tucumanensis TaxID=401106 RepID=A0ABP7JPZ6_9PSEU
MTGGWGSLAACGGTSGGREDAAARRRCQAELAGGRSEPGDPGAASCRPLIDATRGRAGGAAARNGAMRAGVRRAVPRSAAGAGAAGRVVPVRGLAPRRRDRTGRWVARVAAGWVVPPGGWCPPGWWCRRVGGATARGRAL